MADKEWIHRLHGQDDHDEMIWRAERYIVKRGGKLKDTRTFKNKYRCPCQPDIFFEIDAKLIDGNKRTNQKALYVLEVESHATKESILRKWAQYKESLAGLTDLVILDLSDLDAQYGTFKVADKEVVIMARDLVSERERFIEERMPI